MTGDEHHPGRRWHDMGGRLGALGAPDINLDEHDYALWEKRVDALMILCAGKGLLTVDSLRRALEDMGPEAFETMSYYERWVAAITNILVETGVITVGELREAMAAVAARGETYGAAATAPDPEPEAAS